MLTLGAGPSAKLIPVGDYGEAIVIPAGSTMQFRRLEHDSVYFRGRTVIEGTWVLDCDFCEAGQNDNELRLSIVPDPATVIRLPRWKLHNNNVRIVLTGADRFIRSVSTADERKRLLAGTLMELRGHAAVVVDHYEASLECDSASYSARFVAVAKAPRIAKLDLEGDFGCGMI
ncbi:MAG: hypothetical protein ACJ8FL_01455 [Sphingomicrobium sp.]